MVVRYDGKINKFPVRAEDKCEKYYFLFLINNNAVNFYQIKICLLYDINKTKTDF